MKLQQILNVQRINQNKCYVLKQARTFISVFKKKKFNKIPNLINLIYTYRQKHSLLFLLMSEYTIIPSLYIFLLTQ